MTAAGDHIGPYETIDPLGAGGMGEVWRARDARLGRQVAIKLLPQALRDDPDRLRRFELEARATGALSHPNILAVHDFGEHDGTPYLVCELLEGETLRARIRRGPLPPRKAIEISAQIARGLAAAHERGIVHRDLKPENLFVTTDGRLKILDFGLAKTTNGAAEVGGPTLSEGTDAGTVLGSLGYMAPEQVRGQPADARSDLFSLGAVLHEMVAGTRAFEAPTPVEVGYATLNHDPPDLTAASTALQRVVRRCLEKTPGERFQSAQDLAFALEALVGESGPSRPSVPTAAPTRRARRAAAIAAAVIALVSAGWAIGRTSAPRPVSHPVRPTVPRYTRVTYRTGFNGNARFADAGRDVVFEAAVDGEPWQVFLTTPGRREARAVSEPWTLLAALSRDGEMAMVVAPPEGSEYPEWSLAKASLAGGAPRAITTRVETADYAPDGSLALVRAHEGRQRLEYRGKLLFETEGAITFARFSPSGDAIAFLHWPIPGDDRGTVELITLEGRRRTLSGPWGSERGLAWAPSGDEVWYTAGTVDGYALHAVTRSGQDRTVLDGPGRYVLEDIAPDGRVLLARVDERFRVNGRPPGATGERSLSWLDGTVLIDLSADGRTFLFLEGLMGAAPDYQSYVRSTNGDPAIRIGQGFARALSPDGQWAVISPRQPFTTLDVVPTGPGETRSLPPGDFSSISSVRALDDGRRILIAARRSGEQSRLWIQSLASGAPTPIGAEGLDQPTPPSPDGKWVATVRGEGEPVLVSLETGEVRPIAGLARGERPVQWSTDGRSLYVLPKAGRRRRWPVEVFLFDLETQARRPWRSFEPGERAGVWPNMVVDLFVTRDGAAYAFDYVRCLSDLYVVEGLR